MQRMNKITLPIELIYDGDLRIEWMTKRNV